MYVDVCMAALAVAYLPPPPPPKKRKNNFWVLRALELVAFCPAIYLCIKICSGMDALRLLPFQASHSMALAPRRADVVFVCVYIHTYIHTYKMDVAGAGK